jgi:hypothetical protein
MDLLIVYIHDLELQALTTISLISTLYKSLHAKSFPACSVVTSRCLVTAFNNGDSSASVLTSLLSGKYPTLNCQLKYSAISSQPSLQDSTDNRLIAPAVLVITSRHGPHRKHRSYIVACVFVAAGTCLPSCCPVTGGITPFIKNPLPQQRVYTLHYGVPLLMNRTIHLKASNQ